MKQIAIVFEYPTINGGENSMLAVVEHILNTRADIRILAVAPPAGPLAGRLSQLATRTRDVTDAPDRLQLAAFQIIDSRGRRLSRPAVEATLLHIVQTFRPDILHANSLSMGRLVGALCTKLEVPTTCHIRDIMRVSATAVRDLNQHQRIIAVSHATARFHTSQGIDPDRLLVIHNGINIPPQTLPSDTCCETREKQSADSPVVPLMKTPTTAIRQEVRSSLNIPPDAFTALAVGQIGLRKGLDTLAEAATRVSAVTPHTHWLLVGERFSNKDESVEFERLVDSQFRAAEPRLTFHRLGYRRDVYNLMLAADVLVHLARQEPLGRVLLEAAACGLPILATDVGGTAEIVHHNEHALLVPPNEPQLAATELIRLINDPPLRSRLSSAARKRIETSFSIDQASETLLNAWLTAL